LPKFVNIGADARVAVMKGAEGSMRAANALIYANAAIQGTTNQVAGSTNVNGTAVPTIYGFASNVASLALVMDLQPLTDFDAGVTAPLQLQHKGAITPGNCAIGYTAATFAGGVLTAPLYTELTVGGPGNLSAAGCA
jgi:MSHA pilin protein MshA